ncbi:8942_t:CDS:2, partial [Cetraspora pellucida]
MSNRMVKKLDLKITEPSSTMVVTANGARVRALGKVVEVELYVQYDYKVAKIPISCNGENPPMEPEDEEDEGTFDEFEFEDESLEEAEGYFTCKTSGIELFGNPWEDCHSPATYLSYVEELLSNEPEPEPEEEEFLEVKLEKSMCSSSLPLEQCQRALEKLDSEKDIFARDINDLGQMDVLVHEIDTGNAVPIKQAPYRAAPSVREFIRKEVENLKEKEYLENGYLPSTCNKDQQRWLKKKSEYFELKEGLLYKKDHRVKGRLFR